MEQGAEFWEKWMAKGGRKSTFFSLKVQKHLLHKTRTAITRYGRNCMADGLAGGAHAKPIASRSLNDPCSRGSGALFCIGLLCGREPKPIHAKWKLWWDWPTPHPNTQPHTDGKLYGALRSGRSDRNLDRCFRQPAHQCCWRDAHPAFKAFEIQLSLAPPATQHASDRSSFLFVDIFVCKLTATRDLPTSWWTHTLLSRAILCIESPRTHSWFYLSIWFL